MTNTASENTRPAFASDNGLPTMVVNEKFGFSSLYSPDGVCLARIWRFLNKPCDQPGAVLVDGLMRTWQPGASLGDAPELPIVDAQNWIVAQAMGATVRWGGINQATYTAR